ncbi:beta-ketoacyl-ACP synthase II [Candidatus Laterigemmans baculatus]|uniref:beta-ketoacyl-ACP synthase II n=1 Tax=Candidatus Laterigemmans baculatus TaxID=2770505 RepID=UPI0013DC6FBB|nr:beta-ketoacyl-ACP synthase II [Candidatus Laterigemmans baculatus]
MPSNRDVVITGMGLASPLGCELGAFWKAIAAGESGVAEITRFDAAGLPVRFAGEVKDWEGVSDQFFDSKERKRLDRFCQFALWAADRAVAHAGIDFAAVDRTRCGVAIGSAIGGMEEFEEQHTRLLDGGPRKVSPYMIPKLLANSASGLVSIRYGLQGPTTCVATACASANQSIADAFQMIRSGMADVMIAGGAEAAIVPSAISGFARMQALSTHHENPAAASRPWDQARDGFVMAEGSAAFILETAEHARTHGRQPIARLLGSGISSDGYHITSPLAGGEGAAAAMQLALRCAGLAPEAIDYVNAHGTSTPMGDLAETRAIHRVFGEHARRLAVSSTKSQVGHLLGASGAVELVACIEALRHQIAPPTINLENPGEGCDLDYVAGTARPMALRTVMSNSFGFGGHNATLVIGRA